MTAPRILVACIGNVFLGDDAFGVEVARHLASRKLPDGVRVVDYGIRGLDLAYALLDEPDVAIFVDAVSRGGDPGTLFLIEPDLSELDGTENAPASVDAHGMNPMAVLRLVASMGGSLKRILIVGCEPQTLGDENEGAMGLSDSVRRAALEAVPMIESLVEAIVKEQTATLAG